MRDKRGEEWVEKFSDFLQIWICRSCFCRLKRCVMRFMLIFLTTLEAVAIVSLHSNSLMLLSRSLGSLSSTWLVSHISSVVEGLKQDYKNPRITLNPVSKTAHSFRIPTNSRSCKASYSQDPHFYSGRAGLLCLDHEAFICSCKSTTVFFEKFSTLYTFKQLIKRESDVGWAVRWIKQRQLGRFRKKFPEIAEVPHFRFLLRISDSNKDYSVFNLNTSDSLRNLWKLSWWVCESW